MDPILRLWCFGGRGYLILTDFFYQMHFDLNVSQKLPMLMQLFVNNQYLILEETAFDYLHTEKLQVLINSFRFHLFSIQSQM